MLMYLVYLEDTFQDTFQNLFKIFFNIFLMILFKILYKILYKILLPFLVSAIKRSGFKVLLRKHITERVPKSTHKISFKVKDHLRHYYSHLVTKH